jgi:cell division protease FtsH
MANPSATPPTPTEPNGARRLSWTTWLALAIILGTLWSWQASRQDAAQPAVDYSEAYEWIAAGQVESVVLSGGVLEGALREPRSLDGAEVQGFRTVVPAGDDALLPLLREQRVRIKVVGDESSLMVRILLGILPWVLIIGVWLWLSRRAQQMMSVAGGGPGGLGGFLRRGKKFERKATVDVTFEDVAGLAAAKRDLQEIVQFLKEPAGFRKLGGKIPRGVLLVGPPGTGKTLLARAVAGEAAVPFFSISASEFIEMFVGVGAARVRDLFQEAKKDAPAIVFIDELDSVGRIRGAGVGGGHDEREQTLNQLLSEMDGFDRNDRVVVLAATNRPDVLDPALLRPGRFDRRVLVELPELAARRAILAVHVKGKPLADDVDLDGLAELTPGFSGADLANLANEAALHATRRRADAIDRRDFFAAYDKIVLGDPRETKLSPREKGRVAVHEAGHAVLAWTIPEAEPLRRVSILPRGMALGATQQSPSEDRHLFTRAQLEARLAVLLGGHAAERLLLGEISTGAENDLREATALATRMVAHFGMSEALGPVHYAFQEEHAFLGHRVATDRGTSDQTVHAIEREARALLGAALRRAGQAIEAHRGQADRLIAALLERETLERDELDQILGPKAPTVGAGEPVGHVAAFGAAGPPKPPG